MVGGFWMAVVSPKSVLRTVLPVSAVAVALLLSTGCSSKRYVRAQAAPIVQKTNELDARTAQDHRDITDTDQRAQRGIATAQSAADGNPRGPGGEHLLDVLWRDACNQGTRRANAQ